jgi:uncharacterized ion transporter superfamily protein YfcC
VTWRLPNPLVLLVACVAIAAALTWVVPAGQFERREDVATGRNVVVPGTYAPVEPRPVGPFAALVAIPRGVVEAAEVVAVVLFVGGAWVVLDVLGTLGRVVASFVAHVGGRTSIAVPLVALFFSGMGALENMQEEIIPLVPVLAVLGRRLRVDTLTVVGMSAGAAMIGSAFGPTNPFQSGIAMKLAELPPFDAGGLRFTLWAVATAAWIGWTLRHAARTAQTSDEIVAAVEPTTAASLRDVVALLCLLVPMGLYVYGALAWEWGFNELSAGFFAGGVVAGLVGGLGLGRTVEVFLDGMKGLVTAAVLVGVARSISLVLSDGRIVDTILNAMAAPLTEVPGTLAVLLMIPFHALVHIPVSSVSGHAVLTMPILVPLSDLIGVSRLAIVIAYQMGAGLTELVTPTNGSLMAILLAAGVPFGRWIRFAIGGVLLALAVGIVGMLIV